MTIASKAVRSVQTTPCEQ